MLVRTSKNTRIRVCSIPHDEGEESYVELQTETRENRDSEWLPVGKDYFDVCIGIPTHKVGDVAHALNVCLVGERLYKAVHKALVNFDYLGFRLPFCYQRPSLEIAKRLLDLQEYDHKTAKHYGELARSVFFEQYCLGSDIDGLYMDPMFSFESFGKHADWLTLGKRLKKVLTREKARRCESRDIFLESSPRTPPLGAPGLLLYPGPFFMSVDVTLIFYRAVHFHGRYVCIVV